MFYKIRELVFTVTAIVKKLQTVELNLLFFFSASKVFLIYFDSCFSPSTIVISDKSGVGEQKKQPTTLDRNESLKTLSELHMQGILLEDIFDKETVFEKEKDEKYR